MMSLNKVEQKFESIEDFINVVILRTGGFGRVIKGTKKRGFREDVVIRSIPMAKKMPSDMKAAFDFMISCNHPNFVWLLGVFKENLNTAFDNHFLVFQFMENGSLYNFVKENAVDKRFVAKMAFDVCNGMEYLHRRNQLHKNLCAKSIFVDAGAIVKISDHLLNQFIDPVAGEDFVKIEKYPDVPPIRVRWLPPECMPNRTRQSPQWSRSSDIWSFGVLLWETLSKAQVPYGPLPINTVVNKLFQGGNPLKEFQPPNSPKELIEAMASTFMVQPKQRPEFSELKDYFEKLFTKFIADQRGSAVPFPASVFNKVPLATQFPKNVDIDFPCLSSLSTTIPGTSYASQVKAGNQKAEANKPSTSALPATNNLVPKPKLTGLMEVNANPKASLSSSLRYGVSSDNLHQPFQGLATQNQATNGGDGMQLLYQQQLQAQVQHQQQVLQYQQQQYVQQQNQFIQAQLQQRLQNQGQLDFSRKASFMPDPVMLGYNGTQQQLYGVNSVNGFQEPFGFDSSSMGLNGLNGQQTLFRPNSPTEREKFLETKIQFLEMRLTRLEKECDRRNREEAVHGLKPMNIPNYNAMHMGNGDGKFSHPISTTVTPREMTPISFPPPGFAQGGHGDSFEKILKTICLKGNQRVESAQKEEETRKISSASASGSSNLNSILEQFKHPMTAMTPWSGFELPSPTEPEFPTLAQSCVQMPVDLQGTKKRSRSKKKNSNDDSVVTQVTPLVMSPKVIDNVSEVRASEEPIELFPLGKPMMKNIALSSLLPLPQPEKVETIKVTQEEVIEEVLMSPEVRNIWPATEPKEEPKPEPVVQVNEETTEQNDFEVDLENMVWDD